MALRIMGFLKTLIFYNRLNGCTHIDTKRRRSCLIERWDMPARFLLGVEDHLLARHLGLPGRKIFCYGW